MPGSERPSKRSRPAAASNDLSLSRLGEWLAEERQRSAIAEQTVIRSTGTGRSSRTSVSIDHLFPCPLDGFEGWRITTKQTYLPGEHFASHARTIIGGERGRTIYCRELGGNQEVLAAIRYHIDEHRTWPVFILIIATRDDGKAMLAFWQRSVAAAFVLKQYVHAIAAAIGRDPDVYLEVPGAVAEPIASTLGFRKGRRVRGLRVSGTLMCQPPLG